MNDNPKLELNSQTSYSVQSREGYWCPFSSDGPLWKLAGHLHHYVNGEILGTISFPSEIKWKRPSIKFPRLNTARVLVNSRSLGLEVLFRITSSSNYREVDIKIYNPSNLIIIRGFLPIKHKFWVHKRNVSRSRFFYAPKTYVIIDCC